jgi:two-component system KDP operon response regulator KdpE
VDARRILVVEDDTATAELLHQTLRGDGYYSVSVADGLSALTAATQELTALVLLDLNLPELDGFEVCRRIRLVSNIPIIVLSGRNLESDKLHAFELGADDYVTKPFAPSELLARVRAVLRRSESDGSESDEGLIQYDGLTVDILSRRVWSGDREVETTPIEFDLLRVLAMNQGKTLSHRALLVQVWGPEYASELEYLRVHLSHLRQKIEPDPANPVYIHTVPRVGYRFG